MKNKFWALKTKSETEGELLLYGPISSDSWWGDEVTPKQFKKELDDLGNISTLNIYINSDGGDVFAGQAIYSILKRYKAQKIVYVDGLAASIASLIAMAGDLIIMPANAMMMIHSPWTIALGNAADFRKLADDMDKIREAMIVAYKEKSGIDEKKIIEIMDAETWLTAKEAVEYGFADEIEETKKLAASLDENFLTINGWKFDLSKFKKLPEIAAMPAINAGVVPNDVSREKAPEDEPWEAPTLSDFTSEQWGDLPDAEKRRIAGHYAWAKAMPPETFGDLKMPHHRPSDGAVVRRGVNNALARLPQTNIPEEDRDKVRSHLESHSRQFEEGSPGDSGRQKILDEGRTLSAANEQRIVQSRDLLNEVLDQLATNKEGKVDNDPKDNRQQMPVDSFIKQIQMNRRKVNVYKTARN